MLEEANPDRHHAASLRNALADRQWADTLSRRTDADVVHHLLPAHGRGTLPQVVTVHDLAFAQRPDLFARRYATWARCAHARAARAGAAVIVPSRSTAAEAMTRWGLHRERVVVAPHGPGQTLQLPITPAPQPAYVLYVGDDEPRKNLALLRAAAMPAGLPLRRARDGEPLEPLFAEALALVHPSLIEGFGLAAAEAMAAGVPVVAFPAAAVVELCGDAALYAATAAQVTTALELLYRDPQERARRTAAGLARTRRYSWRKSALAHIDAYTLASRA